MGIRLNLDQWPVMNVNSEGEKKEDKLFGSCCISTRNALRQLIIWA